MGYVVVSTECGYMVQKAEYRMLKPHMTTSLEWLGVRVVEKVKRSSWAKNFFFVCHPEEGSQQPSL